MCTRAKQTSRYIIDNESPVSHSHRKKLKGQKLEQTGAGFEREY